MDTQNQQPMMEPKKKHGSLVGLLIIIIIVVIGLLYFLNTDQSPEPVANDGASIEEMIQEDEEAAELQMQGSSDAITDIEADLESTNLEVLDDEL